MKTVLSPVLCGVLSGVMGEGDLIIAYDSFTRADGAIGSTELAGPNLEAIASLQWDGATWTVATNAAANTPTEGSALAFNNEFTTNTTGWTPNNATLTRVDSASDPGVASGGADNFAGKLVDAGVGASATHSAVTVTAGQWYSVSAKIYSPSANTGTLPSYFAVGSTAGLGQYVSRYSAAEDSWVTQGASFRADGTSIYPLIGVASATNGDTVYYDSFLIKPLTLSTLFSSLATSSADVVAQVNITLTLGNQAGLVLNMDSAVAPDDFILAYHDGTNIKLDECVNGTYTNKISVATTYSAGATLRVIRNGTQCAVYYNGVQVGTTQTMTANTNTTHGLFSTYSANRLDNFKLSR